MINRVVLTGRLTRDPELRKTQNGTSVVSYTIAVDRNFHREGQPEADFINCVAWNRTAEVMAQYLHKGSLIGVDGRIQTRSYDNQQGQRVYVTEVVTDNFTFLESRNTQSANGGYGQSYSQSGNGFQSNNTYNQPAPSFSQQDNNFQNSSATSNDNSFDSSFDDDTLDIASDDLPF